MVDDSVPWNRTKTLNQSEPKIREMPKPTAHKAIRVMCNFEQDRKQRQMHRDHNCGRFSKNLWWTVAPGLHDWVEVGWSDIQKQTAQPSSQNFLRDSSDWRSNCSERPIGVISKIQKGERTFSVNESRLQTKFLPMSADMLSAFYRGSLRRGQLSMMRSPNIQRGQNQSVIQKYHHLQLKIQTQWSFQETPLVDWC